MTVHEPQDAIPPEFRPGRAGSARPPLPWLATDAVPAQPEYCGYAVAAIALAFLIPPLGIGFGFAAIHRIRRRQQRGLGLAVAGLFIGTTGTAFFALLVFFIIAMSNWPGPS